MSDNKVSKYLTGHEPSTVNYGIGTLLRTGMILVAFPVGMAVLFYGSKHPEISIQTLGLILIGSLVVTYIVLLLVRYLLAKLFDRNSK